MSSQYALGQLAAAFLTATTHEDSAVRECADRRAQRWMQALEAMSTGAVVVGSRTPAVGLPAWVTLEVLRGGFAPGQAVAARPLESDEIALARRVGLEPSRGLLFGYYVTDQGLAELYDLLERGSYRVDVPEDAALLAMAWLARAGDRAAAFGLLEVLAPFADELRFAPRVTAAPSTPADHVWRSTVADTRRALTSRSEQKSVEAQREALAVWSPFADKLLAHWWPQFRDGRLALDLSEAWIADARGLVAVYERLALVHTRCAKHRKPKENLAILLTAMQAVIRDGLLEPKHAGLLQSAVNAMVTKRGAPGSEQLAVVRDAQRTVAESPAHRELAAVAAGRLTVLDDTGGIPDPTRYSLAVSPGEAEEGVPAGAPMPAVVSRVMARAHAAPIETLLDEGVVPSAEVLAQLVPRISATVVAATYDDPAAARLMAANYRSFRLRRSLLLLNLEKQVQITELPWVRALAPHSKAAVDEAEAVAKRVGALALDHFPATIMPNPLVRELTHLLTVAGHDVPLVEELAADIFMGQFSDKFRRAAQMAARVMSGTLYADYFGIDYAEVLGLVAPPPLEPAPRWPRRRSAPAAHPSTTFASICMARAGVDSDRPSVAANGMVIEQSQILTAHNLAAIVAVGAQPEHSWAELADLAYSSVEALLVLAARQPRPLSTIKNAAFAWRQTIFYLSLAAPTDVGTFIERHRAEARLASPASQVLAGLAYVHDGGRFDHLGICPSGRQFLGWTTIRHWILDSLGSSS